MPAVSNIQTGSLSVTSTALTFNVTLGTAVDLSRSIVFYTHSNGDTQGRNQRHFFSCQLTSTTNIQFIRNDASFFTDNIDIEWTVIEFVTGALQSLQSGSINCTALNTDVTLGTAVDITKVVPIVFWQGNLANLPQTGVFTATLVNSTTLRFSFNTAPVSGNIVVYWQLVEFKTADVTIQSGSVFMPSGTVSTNITLTTVDLTKTLVSFGGINIGNSAENRILTETMLTSPTNLLIRKANIGSDLDKNVAYYVVQFNDGVLVNGGEVTILDTATAPATQPSFTALDPSRTAIWNANLLENLYDSDTVDASAPTNYLFTCVLNGTASGVTIQRQGTAKQRKVVWQVVQWLTSGGGSPQTVTLSGLPSTLGIGIEKLDLSVVLNGLASTLQVGNPKLNLNIVLAGLASSLGIGTLSLSESGVIQLLGLPSTLQIGTPKVNQNLKLTGVHSAAQIGVPKLNQNVQLNGLGSGLQIGTLQLNLNAVLTGIASTLGIGTFVITKAGLLQTIHLTGVPSTFGPGVPTLRNLNAIALIGISSTLEIGILGVSQDAIPEQSQINTFMPKDWLGTDEQKWQFAIWLQAQLEEIKRKDQAIVFVTDSPEGNINARPGTIALNFSGGTGKTVYVKTSGGMGNTGWVNIA